VPSFNRVGSREVGELVMSQSVSQSVSE